MGHRFTAKSAAQSKGSKNPLSDQEQSPILHFCCHLPRVLNKPLAPCSSFLLHSGQPGHNPNFGLLPGWRLSVQRTVFK